MQPVYYCISQPSILSHLIWTRSENKQVEWNGSNNVYEEPALEIVLRYAAWIADHLVVVIHVRGPEIDEDVNNEHDIHHQVHYVERVTGVAACASPLVLLLVEEEGGGVGREDGCVEHQEQDDPVPYCLERAIVENGPLVDAWSLELVFG